MIKKPADAGFFVSIIRAMNARLLPDSRSVIASLFVLVATIVSATTLYILLLSHWHGPFRDMWEIYPFLNNIIDGAWKFSDLWESYGFSHRLLIPKLLYIADYHFASASNHLLIFCSTLSQFFIAAIFISAIKKSSHDIWTWISLSAVVIIFQFSGSLLFNWLHTFDVQWFICSLLVSAFLYIVAIIISGSTGRPLDIFTAMLILVMACLCNFSAMAAWLIWFFAVCMCRISAFVKVIFISIAMVFIFIYTAETKAPIPEITDLTFFLKYIIYLFIYFPSLYLTNPLSDPGYINIFYVHFLAIIVLVASIINFIVSGTHRTKFTEVFLLLVITFCVGVSIVTAIGRGYDTSHVRAMRYQNIVVLFWSAAIPFLYLQAMTYRKNAKIFIYAVITAILSGFLLNQVQFWNDSLKMGRNVDAAHLALMMGYSRNIPMIAPTVSRSMIYVPGYSLERERYLHERSRTGIYHGQLADYWLGYKKADLIQNTCHDIKPKISRYVGEYVSYNALSISGATRDYDAALLRDVSGKPVAAALPERPATVGAALSRLIQAGDPEMKGYILDSAIPVDLVLLHHDGQTHCKIHLPGY